MGRITWNTDVDAPCCPGEIVNDDDGRTQLIQTDWDYPGVASTFGWPIRDVQTAKRESTDFDWRAECGVWRCLECNQVFYPMELSDGECPNCGCPVVERFTACDHRSTDGTVDCECGVKVSDFISAAREWLEDNNGATADDPGYFGNDE